VTEHIKPVGASAGLFSVARAVSPTDPDIDWSHGWALRSACPTGGTWECVDVDDDAEEPDKEDVSDVTSSRIRPFTFYQVAGCAAGTARSPYELQQADQIALDWLEVNTEGWVSAGLEVGMGGFDGLAGLTDITGIYGGPLELSAAVAALIRHRRLGFSFDYPTIHAPSWVAPEWAATFFGIGVPGVTVAFGPGYGVLPAVQLDGSAWMYITGSVEYSVKDMPQAFEQADLEERRRNSSYILRERLAIARFDPCNSYKIKVIVDADEVS
jgi:hypothetical protein